MQIFCHREHMRLAADTSEFESASIRYRSYGVELFQELGDPIANHDHSNI
jgi:hypothetical protein